MECREGGLKKARGQTPFPSRPYRIEKLDIRIEGTAPDLNRWETRTKPYSTIFVCNQHKALDTTRFHRYTNPEHYPPAQHSKCRTSLLRRTLCMLRRLLRQRREVAAAAGADGIIGLEVSCSSSWLCCSSCKFFFHPLLHMLGLAGAIFCFLDGSWRKSSRIWFRLPSRPQFEPSLREDGIDGISFAILGWISLIYTLLSGRIGFLRVVLSSLEMDFISLRCGVFYRGIEKHLFEMRYLPP